MKGELHCLALRGCSETTDKYRRPIAQLREPYLPKEIKTSLYGPIKSSLPETSLRYHRQSTYTDDFLDVKPFHIHGYSLEPAWLDAVGMHGKFYGESTYEIDYEWPEEPSKMPKIPLVSTISWGVLPILGTGNGEKEDGLKHEVNIDDSETKKNFTKKKEDSVKKKKYKKSTDFVPLQDIWLGETTYRRDFLNPPEGWREKLTKPPSPELKFSGNFETTSTSMRDYQDPRNVKDGQYFMQHPAKDKNTLQSRFPAFLF